MKKKRVAIITFCHRDYPVNYGQTLQGLSTDTEIVDIKKVEELVTSYNLTVNKNHTFIASGVIAHNVKAPNKQ